MAKDSNTPSSHRAEEGDLRLVFIATASIALVSAAIFAGAAAVKSQFDHEHVIRAELEAAYEYRSGMRSVLIDLQDAETGQRGFLLTGRVSYLAPFQRARTALVGDLSQLAKPIAVLDPGAVARLSAISYAKFGELEETIRLRQEGRGAAALTVVRSDRGQRYMDSARSLVAGERVRTGRLMATWTKLADQSAQTTQRAAIFVGAVMLLTLLAAAGLIWQVLRQRRRVILELGDANAEITGLLKTSALAEQVSDSGHWSLCVATGEQTWSPGVFTIFGLSGDTPPSVEEVVGHYVDEDRAKVQEQLGRALETRTGLAFEHAIVDARGAAKQLRLKAEFVDDASGGCLIGVLRDVTTERRVQLELAESELRYRHLADSSTDMMATLDIDSAIVFVSPACRRILGYEPEELIGRRTLSLTHPEDVAGVLAVFDGLRRAGPGDATIAYRFRGRHKDGAWVWLEGQPRVEFDASGTPVRYQDVVREIGSRKAAEEALETSRAIALASERRYRLLAENATDMIARYGLDGVIRYISPACLRVLGYSPEELVGRSTVSLIAPEDLAAVRAQFADADIRLPRDAMHTEHRVRRKDGATIWIEGRPRLTFDEAGAPIEYQDVMRDITARKAMESDLREARSAAEAAARSKADFLANMSHELRTPLNSVVGFSGLIADAAELSEDTRRRACIVRDSSRALVEIVNDILDFSKFEAEGVALTPEPTDLPDLLRSSIELMKQQADAKGIRLETGAMAEVGLVLIDPARVRQVAINLLGNAIKFTEQGSVSVTLAEGAEGALTVSVRDSGVGIPEDRLDRIFERFAQADGSTSRRFGGTGLGLTICKLIVQEMGGELEVESVLGEGSTFSFTIDPPRVDAAVQTVEPPHAPRSSLAGLRVLVADDNPFNQELFEALMDGQGLETTLVSNGLEAVRAVEASTFDIVLMDMQMPVMDGLEATRAIRSLGSSELPIVALTANVVPTQIELCLSAGMNDHLAKPYSAEDALAIMARWTLEREAAPGVADPPVWATLSAEIGSAALDALLRKLAAQLKRTAHQMSSDVVGAEELEAEARAVAEASATLGLAEIADLFQALLANLDLSGDGSQERLEAARASVEAARRIERRLAIGS